VGDDEHTHYETSPRLCLSLTQLTQPLCATLWSMWTNARWSTRGPRKVRENKPERGTVADAQPLHFVFRRPHRGGKAHRVHRFSHTCRRFRLFPVHAPRVRVGTSLRERVQSRQLFERRGEEAASRSGGGSGENGSRTAGQGPKEAIWPDLLGGYT
jgi:hypothetical protein